MTVALVSGRVQLRELALEDALSLVEGERPLGHQWADGYPTDRTLVAAGMVVAADLAPFGAYLIVRRQDGIVIGDCGFHGRPDADGAVTIGFEIAPSARGQGYGSDAVAALVGLARTLPGVVTVHAETSSGNGAAQRVLEKAGMTPVSGGDLVHYIG